MTSFQGHEIVSSSPGNSVCSEYSTSVVNITTGQYGFQESLLKGVLNEIRNS